MPIIKEFFPIIPSHYYQTFIGNTRCMVFSWSRNLAFLIAQHELFFFKHCQFIFTNWNFWILCLWAWAAPKKNSIFHWKYWKSLQLKNIFCSYNIKSHSFAVHLDDWSIVLTSTRDAAKNEDLMVKEDDPVSYSGVLLSSDLIEKRPDNAKLLVHLLILIW